MKIHRSKKFNRQFGALPIALRKQAIERILLFSRNEFDPILNNHGLKGYYANFRSINVNGDYRIIYERTDVDIIRLRFIGSHHQLYGK